ncbi:MAG: (Fe-S)-binding protein [Deltaproteobacteria bacterium]|nr:MAG: (Fe-S)-binding protein [Deltaproteobacteria bacterium]
MNRMRDIVSRNRAWYCLACGKCSAICPITRWDTREYCSPRLLVEKAINGDEDNVFKDPLFWSCLTCNRCSQLCPSNVHFSGFIRDSRALARQAGHLGDCSHGDVIRTWGQMMTNPDLEPNRLDWLDNDLKISKDSDILYFVGCLPYYDTLFKNMDIEGIEIARAAIKIMNHMGIEPQVLTDERCCGHDQIWEGDLETFQSLAGLNLERINQSGARQIVTTCPECARTLKLDYPKLLGDHGLEILHLTQFVSRNIADFGFTPREENSKDRATYQDACRLSRHLGIYDEPRELIKALGFELTEMERTHRASLCCGTSGWTACGRASKNIQVERLTEARATGADLLVTTCVKCQIHFRCTQQGSQSSDAVDIRIRDLTTLLADRLA